jgi:hypothetical protein
MDTVSGREATSGQVRFDDRGNAVWDTKRGKRLDHPGLTLLDEEPSAAGPVAKVNAKGGRIGYDPYESGMLKKKHAEKPRKKDLRALSNWIQMQKGIGQSG